MVVLKWALPLVAVYGALVLALYAGQRALMYFPDTRRVAPASAGLPRAVEVALTTQDGETLVGWHIPPERGKPLVLYFPGNGGGLDLRAERFRRLTADGTGLLAIAYRGYGGSSGRPTEAGLLLDAGAAYDFVAARHPAADIVLWGESLGTGVAVALAAERPLARVLLQSPFTSAVDIAAATYWFVPVRLLMRDQFRSDTRIRDVTVPVLVLHGTRDRIIDISFGERLYAMIAAPKTFIRLEGAGHNDHDAFGAVDAVRGFIAGDAPPP